MNREAMSIDDPVQFARVAAVLLRQVRDLNRHTGELFASSGKTVNDPNLSCIDTDNHGYYSSRAS